MRQVGVRSRGASGRRAQMAQDVLQVRYALLNYIYEISYHKRSTEHTENIYVCLPTCLHAIKCKTF